ncbi:hypothetical protein ABK040_006619 [Willaertia magna]
MIKWKPLFFTASILIVVLASFLFAVHFAIMIPWFVYGVYNFAVYNLFLLFADVFFIALGVTSIVYTIAVEKSETSKHKRLLLILLVTAILFTFTIAYPFVLFLQWTSQFAISTAFTYFFGPALSFISPSFAVVFCCAVLMLGIFASISAFGYLKQTEPDLWLYLKGRSGVVGAVSNVKAAEASTAEGTSAQLQPQNIVINTENLIVHANNVIETPSSMV